MRRREELEPGSIRKLVRPDEGLISRQVFSDPAIYEQELEQIFAKCWLMLCHETQIPEPYDYFTTTMGEDPVIVLRQRDGSIAAFLNSCRHRGMKLCRADLGNARTFTCTYHGWAYDAAGSLISVPELEGGYQGKLKLDDWGLPRVAQLDTYRGLVFATWDPEAPSLQEYLGDMAWYLDAMFDRVPAGAEIVGDVEKWIFRGNWKLAAEQFTSDMYHAPVSHMSAIMALMSEQDPQADGAASEDEDGDEHDRGTDIGGLQYSSPMGHGTGFYTDAGGVFRGSTDPELESYYKQRWPEFEAHLGVARATGPIAAHGNVFPNFSYLPLTNSFRVWHPRGPNKMEVYSWILCDKDAPDSVKEAQRRHTQLTFSVGGLFEQDDGENWSEIQETLVGAVQRRYDFNYQMGMGDIRDDADYPGRLSGVMSEEAARGFYRRYVELMEDDAG